MNDAGVARTIAARWALLVVCLVLSAGVFRVSINADPTRLLASDSNRYAAYQSILDRFPGERLQVLVFTEAPVFDPDHLKAYKDVQLLLVELPEVLSVGSLFSSRQLSDELSEIIEDSERAHTASLVGDLTARFQEKSFLPSRLVSSDFDALMMTVTLDDSIDRASGVQAIATVLTDHYKKRSDIRWSIAGNPVVERTISSDVTRELLRATFWAMLFAVIVALCMLRDVYSVMAVLAVPSLAVICTVGSLGWLGIDLTLLSQSVLIIVFLVVYSDTLHALRGGRTLHSLMLACGLTSLTTSAAAVALLFASSVVIQEFGQALLAGIAVGFVVWCLWLFSGYRSSKVPANGFVKNGWRLPRQTSTKTIFVSAVIVLVVLLVPATQLRTGFSLDENLPRSHGAATSLRLAEQRFSGYLPLQVTLTKQDQTLSVEGFLKGIRGVQGALNADLQVSPTSTHHWYSVLDVLALVPGFSERQRLASLPRSLRRSLWNSDGEAVLFAPYSIHKLLSLPTSYLTELDDQLQTLANQYGLTASVVTGMPALVRGASDELIPDAWRSICLTLIALALLVGGLLRSWRLALLAAVPVVFSLAGLAAALVLLGEPLRHIGVVLMAIVLGLSVDNALHLIVSARHDVQRSAEAIRVCLPVLRVSTLTIVAGFFALTLSEIPSLSIAAMATAASLSIGFITSVLWLPPLLVKR